MESDQALDECRRGRLTVTGSRLGLSTPKRAYLASLDLAPLCFVRYTVHSALLLLLLSSRWLEQSTGHDVLLSFGGATDAISSGAIKGSKGGAPSVLPDLSSTDCCCILLHSTLPTCALSCAPTLYRPVIVSWRGTLNEPLRLPFNLE